MRQRRTRKGLVEEWHAEAKLGDQASLPVKLSRLGVNQTKVIANSAYVGSCALTKDLVAALLGVDAELFRHNNIRDILGHAARGAGLAAVVIEKKNQIDGSNAKPGHHRTAVSSWLCVFCF